MLVIQWILFVPLNWGQLVSIYIPIDRNILSCYLRFHNSSSYNIQLMIHILNFTTIPKKLIEWLCELGQGWETSIFGTLLFEYI